MKQKTILPDTSLCAIVRDEMMNPAGGIVDFVESIVPFVEQAVIVDTGSLDRTRQTLEELREKYSNLAVYDRAFDDFASSRNYALSQVKTKRALVLDADELLTEEDFEKLKELVDKNPDAKMRFHFLGVNPDYSESIIGHNPRLFPISPEIKYTEDGPKGEFLCENGKPIGMVQAMYTGIEIKHFEPDKEGVVCKFRDWYDKAMFDRQNKAPSQIPSFQKWKKFNPRREEYR